MTNLAMKDKALARLQEPDTKMDHYYPPQSYTDAADSCTVTMCRNGRPNATYQWPILSNFKWRCLY